MRDVPHLLQLLCEDHTGESVSNFALAATQGVVCLFVGGCKRGTCQLRSSVRRQGASVMYVEGFLGQVRN